MANCTFEISSGITRMVMVEDLMILFFIYFGMFSISKISIFNRNFMFNTCFIGLSIHTFHGNFFVRSTDLLSLPNINPDAGYGMQMSIEESLTDMSTMCFQAALLYTSSKGR